MKALADKAHEALAEWGKQRDQELLAEARKAFRAIFKSAPDECEIRKDYWGEYVFIKANGLAFRYSKHRKEYRSYELDDLGWPESITKLRYDLRLGQQPTGISGWFWKRRKWWKWSVPIQNLEGLARQLDNFREGLIIPPCSRGIGYP